MHRPSVAVISALLLASVGAHAQTGPSSMDHAAHRAGHHAVSEPQGALPTLPGQDAFGAIQEIVGILEADPRTDWSRVDIDALREHLIDMNEVALRAQARPQPVDGGLRIEVTGSGRTLTAVRRMLAAHAAEMDGRNGWSVAAVPMADGAVLTVTSDDPAQVARIRGLGFLGIMATGGHHQRHHLAMARGDLQH